MDGSAREHANDGNLGKMSSIGLLKPLSAHAATICDRLKNVELLRKARIHPFVVLQALKVYSAGSGDRGKLSWEVNESVVGALDAAFYLSFKVSCLISGCSSEVRVVHLGQTKDFLM